MGLFVTFEGIDGSGKTTQIEKTATWLQSAGYNILVSREPGGTELGEAIRSILLDPRWHNMEPRAEYFLYSASRAQLVEEKIRPHLQRDKSVVILDRYYDSSTAYQGGGRELSVEKLMSIHSFVTGDLVPDLTLYLDVDWETSLQRRSGVAADRLEQNEHEFFNRVRQTYLALCASDPQRMIRVDACGGIAATFETIRQLLAAKLS